jgi:hypothetical protein
MPDVLSPLAPKLPSTPKKTRTAHQALKGARIRVKSKPRPATVAASAFAIGDHISHPQFGEGTVTQIDAAKLMINFASCGTKQIIDSYVERRTAG